MYSGMLWFYPRAHLRQYREQMQQVFADVTRETLRTRGAWGMIGVLARALVDTGTNAITEHVAERGVYMEILKRWVAKKMDTEKFDPFWGGFYMGIVCSAQVIAGLLMIEFADYAVTPQAGVGFWQGMGVAMLASAALGFGVQMIQLRAYNKRMKTLGHPVSEFRIR